jgi:cytochrome c oxidase assembly protein subunit 15
MASLSTSVSISRHFVPRIPKDFSSCRHCLLNRSLISKSFRSHFTSLPLPANIRRTAQVFPRLRNRIRGPSNLSISFLSTTARPLEPSKSRFPTLSDKVVAYWLLGSAASVFGIVVFGGLTRLTESGYVSFVHGLKRIHIHKLPGLALRNGGLLRDRYLHSV